MGEAESVGRTITRGAARTLALDILRQAEEARQAQQTQRICAICQVEHEQETCEEFVDLLITEMGGLLNAIRALEGWQAMAREYLEFYQAHLSAQQEEMPSPIVTVRLEGLRELLEHSR